MIYCNWAATSPVKLYDINSQINSEFIRCGFAPDELTNSLRKQICQFFNFSNTQNVVFGAGVTDLLNKLILGFWEKNTDGEVLTTSLEHNSVLRPLNYLKSRKNIIIKHISQNNQGKITPDAIKANICKDTKLCIVSHASNVTGIIQPIAEIADVCRKHDIRIIIDCAQTAGKIQIDFDAIKADALVFSTHKGLMGPSGFGFALLKNDFKVAPIFSGGTGIKSELEFQPEEMPWLLEAGTPNYEAIQKTEECLNNFLQQDYLQINKQISMMFMDFVKELEKIGNCRVIGNYKTERLPFINILFDNFIADEISYILYKSFNIITRAGLHCSPLIHKQLGTYPYGTTRVSFGADSLWEEMEAVIKAVKQITAGI